MGTYTPNLNLYKPDASDDFGNFRQEFNNNMDKLDNGGGGGSGGHTIIDENDTPMTQRTGLQFTGNVSVSDDAVNDKTVVDILGGGSNLILDASIYSTEEKEVGVWVDNKPIYKKSALIQNIYISANSDTTVNISDYFSNVESVVDYECCGSSGEVIFPNMMAGSLAPYSIGVTVEQSSNHIIFTRGGGGSATISVYLTLYYTKTTDTAGSGGYEAYGFSPVIYSDVERKVGVWRDNKPLYAKTFVQHSTNVSGAGVSFDVSDLDIDTCVDVFGTCDRIVTGVGTLIYEFNSYEDSGLRTYLAYSKFNTCINFNIRFYVGESTSTQYITILYTKNSDVAGSGDYNTYGVPTVHYSTSEQVIGTWLGKPLYQKVFTGLSVVLGSDWVNAIDISTMDMEVCTLGIGIVSNIYQTPLCTRINGNYLQAYMNGMGGVTITTIVIQYTKTTD